MLCPPRLILIPVFLGCSWGLKDLVVSSFELRVYKGDSVLMGCVVRSTEEKHLIKVDWILSTGEPVKDEFVLYYYANLSVPLGHFQNRARLVGDISRNDGSLLLQDVQEADQGTYTCEIRLKEESMVFKTSVVLHVLPEAPKEFSISVGDSVEMGCVFQGTKDKQVTKADWVFHSGVHAKEEIVFHYDFRSGYSQNRGHFRSRVTLIGDISHNDASIKLHTAKESDQGNYICSIHLGNVEFRKTIVLHVNQEKHHVSSPQPTKPELLQGNQLVIIVGIVCATLLLLPALILIVKKTNWNKSSADSTTQMKSLENTKKANPEKNVYSSITTQEALEEDPHGQSEATYMVMHPIWPSLGSCPNNPVEKQSAWRIPKTEQVLSEERRRLHPTGGRDSVLGP